MCDSAGPHLAPGALLLCPMRQNIWGGRLSREGWQGLLSVSAIYYLTLV